MVVSLKAESKLRDHCYGEGEFKKGKRTMQDKEEFTAAECISRKVKMRELAP